MDSNVETYKRKKHELATIVDRWWTHEDIFMDFRELLKELKALASQCPDAFSDKFELEVQEIEQYLRNECLID